MGLSEALSVHFSESPYPGGSCDPITVRVFRNATVLGGTPPYNFPWNFADHSGLGDGADVRHT